MSTSSSTPLCRASTSSFPRILSTSLTNVNSSSLLVALQTSMSTTGRSTLTTAATLRATLWSRTSGRYVECSAAFTTSTRLTIATTGHPQLGRRAEVPSLAIRHRYFAYPRQRFQRSSRFRRTASFHDREVWRRVATSQVAYVLQPSGSASLQDQRSAHAEAHMGCRGDCRLRTGVRRKK